MHAKSLSFLSSGFAAIRIKSVQHRISTDTLWLQNVQSVRTTIQLKRKWLQNVRRAWATTNLKRNPWAPFSRFSLIASAVAGGTGCAYILTISKQFLPFGLTKEEKVDMFPVEPVENFRHPYDEKPLWWRILLVSKRIVILARCFAPFFALSILMLITNSEEWR